MEGETKLEEKEEVNSEIVTKNDDKSLKNEVAQSDEAQDDVEALKKKATLLLLQGKRSIYIRDYHGALVALSEACQLFSQILPEQSDELADPYFYYGKALLEVGRSESEVLGDQMQEDNDDDDDDEDEDDDEDREENPEADKGSSLNENGTNSHNETSEQSKSNEGETEESKVGNENENSENGEINDLQLSWEYLELAKLIYLKKAETCRETAIKLAETYLCLGENGLESENYSVAVEDIKQALELQKKHLKPEDRRIAETLYQLGVAYSLGQNYDEAIESFKNAIEQLEKKIASLEMRKKIGDKKTEEEERDAFYTMDGEMMEIRAVIKDVEEKIKDMMESKNKVKAELLKQVCGDGQSSSSPAEAAAPAPAPAPTSTIPATDISHLIKRKRKNEEDEGGQEKKTKTE